jgi:2-polyprenyl-3-methyl-5-hydroxy-6-metoxy-1,4-benzoquinol methylase
VIKQAQLRTCDLCGATDADFLMAPARLDGPLVKCRRCGLVYVGHRIQDYTFAGFDADKSRALSERVRALGLVDEMVEQSEAPWRAKLCRARLHQLHRYITRGKLLEVGCAAGDFLQAAAQAGFEVEGVETDPYTSVEARTVHGLKVTTGALRDAAYPADHFDAAVMFHVLEHLDSPRRTVEELHRVLKLGGILAIETPNIDTVWFRLFGPRWRQFIPDHYYFFTPRTLGRLLEEVGFRVLEVRRAARPMSVRLFVDRLRRLNSILGQMLGGVAGALGLQDRTLHLKLGDVMLAFAQKIGS